MNDNYMNSTYIIKEERKKEESEDGEEDVKQKRKNFIT